jgi:hypothetical protein
MDEKLSEGQAIYNELKATYDRLQASKPEERGELARRFAVTATELEKVLAYYNTYVLPLYY